MPKSNRGRRRRPEGTNARRNRLVSPGPAPIARTAAPDLSREARVRLAMLDWHRAHGANVARTARHFGFSRPTVYRWLARYERYRLESLEARSSRPRRRRRPTWTPETVEAVRRLRTRYPRWGKDKLAVLLAREGRTVSVSMVGRILAALRRRGALLEPLRHAVTRGLRAWRRPHATRKPPGWPVAAPGDLVELDTVHLEPAPGVAARQFTARDLVSRWDVLELVPRATAAAAAGFLDALAARSPFPVRAIQVDGGSEFMAEFEAACAARGIRLFVLPPRSPRLNGAVERANRTHAEEFHELAWGEPDLARLRRSLLRWERTYNTVRPHQALGYLTPDEFLARWRAAHPTAEM
jgi:putative transposase